MKKSLMVLLACLLMMNCALASGETLRIYENPTGFYTLTRNTRMYLADGACFYGHVTVEMKQDRTVPVYAYPAEDGWRGAGGKAAVSLKEPFTALAWSEDGEWLLIDYETGSGHRIGYIRRLPGMQIAVPTLNALHIPLTLTKDFTVTDDPNDSIRTIASVKAGDAIDVLGYTGYVWAYVELKIDGQRARGFLPLTALEAPAERALPDMAAQLAGVWRFIGGGEVLSYGAVFDGQGRVTLCDTDNLESFPPASLVVRADAQPCEYRVYLNELGNVRYPGCLYILEVRGSGVERFGMQLTPAGMDGYERMTLTLYIGEGGGGYEQANDIPVTYE